MSAAELNLSEAAYKLGAEQLGCETCGGDDGATEGLIHILDGGESADQYGANPNGKASRIDLMAFDEFLSGNTSVSDFTSPMIAGLMGTFDQMVIQAQVDQVTAGGAHISCELWHSGDGVNFIQKGTTAIIEAFPLTVLPQNVVTYVPMGYDDGSTPTLAFVRLKFIITASGNINAHVKARVTLNDLQEKFFAREADLEFKKEHAGLPLDYWLSAKKREQMCRVAIHKAWHDSYANGKPPPKSSGKNADPPLVKAAKEQCVKMGMVGKWVDYVGDTSEESQGNTYCYPILYAAYMAAYANATFVFNQASDDQPPDVLHADLSFVAKAVKQCRQRGVPQNVIDAAKSSAAKAAIEPSIPNAVKHHRTQLWGHDGPRTGYE